MIKETEPLVSIIILNYNAGQLLTDCVNSILHSDYSNYEIIVVDNASKDQSHIKCKQSFTQVRLIENAENLGYCEGNNIGIRNSKGEFVVILNPDTLVEPNWVKELLSAYKKFGDGLYQPKFLTTTNHEIIMSTGNMIQLFGFGYARGKGELDNKQFEEPEIIGYASGTCLFTSSKLIKELGMLDPFLFAYHDDLDLGWRAAMMGIKSYYIPRSIVYHPSEGFSFKWSPFKFYLLERNRQYCLLTHYSRTTLCKILPALFLVEIAVTAFYTTRGMLRLKIRANLDILKNRKTIKNRYRELQKFRKLSDHDIIKSFQDQVYVPKEVANKLSNKMFNNFIKTLSKMSRHFV
jgi:GT2 family glycosyltransferase